MLHRALTLLVRYQEQHSIQPAEHSTAAVCKGFLGDLWGTTD